MPSKFKRINLTVPDDVYEKILRYKEEQAIFSDATACLQLVVKQLRAEENSRAMLNLMRNISREDFTRLTSESFDELQPILQEISSRDK